MAQTPMYDPLTSEVQSPLIAGLTEACSKLSGILNTKISVMTDYPLTEVYSADDDRYRIYQASLGNKLWLSNPSPVFYRNGIEITPENDSFTVDYLGGSITFDEGHRLTEKDKLTVDATFVIGGSEVIDSIQSELSSIGISVEKYKGYFSSYDELIGDYSSGNAGDYAIVGGTESAFYIWNDTTNNWEIVGKEPDLSNFYTQEETNSLLEQKQDKLIGSSGQIVGFDENGNVVAQEAPQSGVTSFNGRTGEVVPKSGDYTAEMVSAAPISEIERIDSVLYGSDIAIGAVAYVPEDSQSVALGAGAYSAAPTESVVIGPSATIDEAAYCSVAVGSRSSCGDHHSSAFGESARADGELSTAIGSNSSSVDGSVALGGDSHSSGTQSISVGLGAIAEGGNSIAVGCASNASGTNSTALGSTANASGNYSTALGSYANANATCSTALGYTANASGVQSTALGYTANASGTNSTALGSYANASAPSSAALGYSATASGINSTALGRSANASANYSTALGSYANVSGTNSTALGYYAVTSNANSIQLGNASTLSTITAKVAITVTSDERDKADITPVGNGAVEFLRKIKAVRYVWNGREMYIDEDNLSDADRENKMKYGLCAYDREAHAKGTKKGSRVRIGVLAQEIQAAMQEVYGTTSYANLVNDNLFDFDPAEIPEGVENQLAVNYEGFIPFLIKAVQELDARLKIAEGV